MMRKHSILCLVVAMCLYQTTNEQSGVEYCIIQSK